MPLEGLRVNGSLTYLDAEFRRNKTYLTLDNGLAPFKGLQRPFAPKWSWNVGASYEVPIAEEQTLTFSADANGRSTMFEPRLATTGPSGTGPAPTTRFKLASRIEGFTLVNARVEYRQVRQGWSVAGFGRNVFIKSYIVAVQGDGIAPNYGAFVSEPVTYGIELGLRF